MLPTLINIFSTDNEINVKSSEKSKITEVLAAIAKKSKVFLFGITFLIIISSVYGILKLEVENSFINYFDKETEIYKGMKKIDEDLGGTTPLNIILKFPKLEENKKDDEFSEWEDEVERRSLKLNIGSQEIKWIK